MDLLPFAIVGSERNVVIDGRPVRGRKNRYGVINVENEEHCEFIYLRNFLTRTHLQDLIETTAQIHYEAFRAKQLMAIKESSGSQPSFSPAPLSGSPQAITTPNSLGSNILTSPQMAMGSPAQSQKSVPAFS
ncbi:hypothetical protein G6F56_012957 [Rhizopus delemar]|nr:hypothetical protein G6F56_012957 [Rhizopus delemar]